MPMELHTAIGLEENNLDALIIMLRKIKKYNKQDMDMGIIMSMTITAKANLIHRVILLVWNKSLQRKITKENHYH